MLGESLLRRPQRLLLPATVCMLVLLTTTYLSLTSSGSSLVRDKLQSIPGWGAAVPQGGAAGNPSTGEDYKAAAIGNISQPHRMGSSYPKTVEDLRELSTKGDDNNLYPPTFIPQEVNKAPRARAGFIVLVRNQELSDMRGSMASYEDRFNRKYGYPWIFLNDVPFTEEFKNGVKQMTRSEVRFGLVPKEHWSYPDWINQTKAAECRKAMVEKEVIYGDSESYRHMCRFQSGFFFRHPLTQDLDYYWRVEPGTSLFCDVDYDPFVFMQLNGKKYGFTESLYEYEETIPTLWDTTKAFVEKHPDYVAKDNSLHFMTDEPERGMEPGYNLCHFWSNFEIGDLSFWRGKKYMEYFEHLDKAGGVRHACQRTSWLTIR